MVRVTSGAFTPSELQATGKVPKGYTLAPDDTDYAEGLYGHGFGGEVVICLLAGDDGGWFRDLCAAKSKGRGWWYETWEGSKRIKREEV